MKILIAFIIATVAYGCWYFYRENPHSVTTTKSPSVAATDASGNPTTWVFTAEGCGSYCEDTLKELKNRGVAFVEKKIDPKNAEDADVKLWRTFNTDGSLPVIASGGNNTSGYYVPNIATVLGKTFGDQYLTADEKRYFKQHFNADGSPRIVVYGTDWCRFCAALRKQLKNHNVDFVDIDVEKSGEQERMSNTMGINGYPATWVGYTRVVNGDDFNEVMNELKKY